MTAIQNTLDRDSPHRAILFDPGTGDVIGSMQRATYWLAMEMAVDHAIKHFDREKYWLRYTLTEPDHVRVEVQEASAEGRIVCKIAEIAPPWTVSACPPSKPTAAAPGHAHG